MKMKRFDVGLFIVHPTEDPVAISGILGLEPTRAWRVGDERTTPDGDILSGRRVDTRWRFSRRYETSDQWFFKQVEDLVELIEPHAEFIRELVASGGEVTLEVWLLGDGYFGDSIPAAFIKRLSDLHMGFGLESFLVPQNGHDDQLVVTLMPRPQVRLRRPVLETIGA